MPNGKPPIEQAVGEFIATDAGTAAARLGKGMVQSAPGRRTPGGRLLIGGLIIALVLAGGITAVLLMAQGGAPHLLATSTASPAGASAGSTATTTTGSGGSPSSCPPGSVCAGAPPTSTRCPTGAVSCAGGPVPTATPCVAASSICGGASRPPTTHPAAGPTRSVPATPTSTPTPPPTPTPTPTPLPCRPVVTAVSPSSGSSGQQITITGCGFTAASQVEFINSATGGTENAASFRVVNDQQITATAPTFPVGSNFTYDVTVVTPQGTTPMSAADHFQGHG